MLRALVTAGAYTANTNIPLTLDAATNNKATLITSGTDANTIRLNTWGLEDIKANIVFTATAAGDVTAQLFADGVAVPGALATYTAAAAGTVTFNINDVLRVVPALYPEFANISVQINAAGTLVGGAVVAEYRR